VVDVVDPDRDSHMETTETLLTELELHCIPRLLVYNKADLLDEQQRGRALGGRPDAVLVSSIQRESTRPLLGLIAEKLNHRWERAQKVPQA
jgi:GTP-binding protein HflX